jgi:hypothetical protein
MEYVRNHFRKIPLKLKIGFICFYIKKRLYSDVMGFLCMLLKQQFRHKNRRWKSPNLKISLILLSL